MRILAIAVTTIGILAAAAAFAAGVRDAVGISPYLSAEREPAPVLTVDPPDAGYLARGVLIVQYQIRNLRIVPVFGAAALDVSPRVGHLHVTIDDLPWHWADASDNSTVVVAGLPRGQHKLLIEVAGPDHRVITGQTITFTVPDTGAHPH